MSDTKVTVQLPIVSLVQLLLIICKLGGVAPIAGWSWWLVFAPLWLSVVGFFLLFLVFFVIALLGELVK